MYLPPPPPLRALQHLMFYFIGIGSLEKVCATSSPNDKLTDEVQEVGVIRMSCLGTYKSIPLEIKNKGTHQRAI